MFGRVNRSVFLPKLVVWGSTFFSLLVAMAISDVEFIEAFWILCVVAIQTLGGVHIYRWCTRVEREPTPEILGMGFAIGSFLAVIGDQLALGTPFKSVGWLLPVIIGFLAYLFTPKQENISTVQLRSGLIMPWAIAGAFISLGLEWYWTFPIGVALALTLFYVEFRMSSVRAMRWFGLTLLVAMVVAVTLLMLKLRPEIWWLEHTFDFVLYENWSNAVSIFGRVGIGGVGYEFNYHWFAYAWNGLVSRVSSARPWVATTRSSVLVAAVVIQLLLSAIVGHYRKSEKFANLSAVMLAMFSTVALWRGDSMHLLHLESFSGIFALVWLLAVLLMVLKARDFISIRHCVLIVFLCLATFGAKTAFGGVAVVIVFALCVEVFVNRKKEFKLYIFVAMASLGVVLFFADFLFLDSHLPKIWGPSLGFIEFLPAMESENQIFRKHEVAFLAIWWIAGALLVQLTAAVVFAINTFKTNRVVYLIETLVASSCIGLLCIVSFWDGNQNYFAYSAFVVLLPLVGSFLFNDTNRELFQLNIRWRSFVRVGPLVLLTIFLAIATMRMPEIGVATRTQVLLRHTPYLASSAILVAAVVFWQREIRSSNVFRVRIFPTLLVAILSMSSVFFYFSEWSHEVNHVFRRWEREGPGKVDLIYGSHDIQEVINWINTNTDTDSIVAFDYDTYQCPIDPWGLLDSECTRAVTGNSTEPHMGREVLEGAIRRQLLLRNLHPLAFGADLTMAERLDDIELKRSATRDYSATANIESLRILQEFSVAWLIVSLEQNPGAVFGDSTKVRLRNENFLILEL